MTGCPCQPVLNIFRVFMVMRVLVRVFLFVRMRMWVFVCILTVMRVRMDMVVVMFLLCIPIVHAHHRARALRRSYRRRRKTPEIFQLQPSALPPIVISIIVSYPGDVCNPPRGMKFERDFRSA